MDNTIDIQEKESKKLLPFDRQLKVKKSLAERENWELGQGLKSQRV